MLLPQLFLYLFNNGVKETWLQQKPYLSNWPTCGCTAGSESDSSVYAGLWVVSMETSRPEASWGISIPLGSAIRTNGMWNLHPRRLSQTKRSWSRDDKDTKPKRRFFVSYVVANYLHGKVGLYGNCHLLGLRFKYISPLTTIGYIYENSQLSCLIHASSSGYSVVSGHCKDLVSNPCQTYIIFQFLFNTI